MTTVTDTPQDTRILLSHPFTFGGAVSVRVECNDLVSGRYVIPDGLDFDEGQHIWLKQELDEHVYRPLVLRILDLVAKQSSGGSTYVEQSRVDQDDLFEIDVNVAVSVELDLPRYVVRSLVDKAVADAIMIIRAFAKLDFSDDEFLLELAALHLIFARGFQGAVDHVVDASFGHPGCCGTCDEDEHATGRGERF